MEVDAVVELWQQVRSLRHTPARCNYITHGIKHQLTANISRDKTIIAIVDAFSIASYVYIFSKLKDE